MSYTPGNVVASLTVTEEDVFYALVYREQPKDWRKFAEIHRIPVRSFGRCAQ